MTPPRKYKSEPITIDGIRFDSKKEGRRWAQLQLLQRAGEISGLERQVKIALMGRDGPILTPTGRQAYYVADFTYWEKGVQIWDDAKGFRTPEYLLKRAILAAQGIEIRET